MTKATTTLLALLVSGVALCQQEVLNARIDGPTQTAKVGDVRVLHLPFKWMKALAWTSLDNERAEVLDPVQGRVAFHHRGPAMFRVRVANRNRPVMAIMEIEDRALDIRTPEEMWQRVGDVRAITIPVIDAQTGEHLTQDVGVTSSDDTILKLGIKSNPAQMTGSATVSPGGSLYLAPLKEGEATVTATSNGVARSFVVYAYVPKLLLRHAGGVNQGEQFTIDAQLVSSAFGAIHDHPSLSVELTTSTGKLDGLDFDQSEALVDNAATFQFLIASKDPVSLKATLYDPSNPTKVLDRETLSLEPAAIITKLNIVSLRRAAVIGDTVSLTTQALDSQESAVPQPLKIIPELQDLNGNPVKDCSLSYQYDPDKKKEFLHIADAKAGEYRLVLWIYFGNGQKIKSDAFRITLLDEFEVRADLDTSREPADLFGSEVAREYYVYRITAKNNMVGVEDSNLGAGTIDMLGSTMLFPAILERRSSNPPIAAEDHLAVLVNRVDSATTTLAYDNALNDLSSYVNDDLKMLPDDPIGQRAAELLLKNHVEIPIRSNFAPPSTGAPPPPPLGQIGSSFEPSTPDQIADFARNADGGPTMVKIYLSPTLLEQYTEMKDAIQDRDPWNQAKNFVDDLVHIATFLNAAFAERTWSIFRNEGDMKRLNLGKGLADFIFSQNDTIEGHRGKGVASLLAKKASVSPGDPQIFYALIPKSALRHLYEQTNLRLTIYPNAPVIVQYAKEGPSTTTKG